MRHNLRRKQAIGMHSNHKLQRYKTSHCPINSDGNDGLTHDVPALLRLCNGDPVTSESMWSTQRRGELLALFAEHVYGYTPPERLISQATVQESSPDACAGKATRLQVCLCFSGARQTRHLHLLLYVPNDTPRPVPVFCGLNFNGNHTVAHDKAVRISRCTAHHERGKHKARWPIEYLIEHGYAVMTACYHDLYPDTPNGRGASIQPLFHSETQHQDSRWGAVATWAWGLSRMLDYIHTNPAMDPQRVAAFGHSRLGKAALWAGACDTRFSLVISNNSGCTGAALARSETGETVENINAGFPHWFCENYRRYNRREASLPVDQHMLLALMAPRPVYIASAEDDHWANPRGELASALLAAPAFELLGHSGLPCQEMPPANTPATGRIGYHIRTGGHGVTLFDWKAFVAFADYHLT